MGTPAVREDSAAAAIPPAAAKAAAPRAPRAKPRSKTRATASRAGAKRAAVETIDTTHGIHADASHDVHAAHYDDDIHSSFPLNWAPPAHLEAPKARPGMVQRWVRFDLRGEQDARNISAQTRQGWRPRGFNTVPADERSRYPKMKMGSLGEVMKSGDLVLCEMPQKLFNQMKDFYQSKREQLVKGLEDKGHGEVAALNAADNTDHGFGAISVTRKSTSGTRRPAVAADMDE